MKYYVCLLVSLLLSLASVEAINYEYERTIPLADAPRGIAMASDGNIWIACSGSNKVVKVNTDGEVLQTITGSFNTPYDVSEAADGTIYVADRGNKSVKKFSSTGELLTTLSIGENVNGVTVAPNGEVHVAGLLAIYVYDNDELVRTITTLSTDKFREARKVAFSSSSTYYVDKNTGLLQISDDSQDPATVALLIKKLNGVSAYNYLAYAVTNSEGEVIISSEGDKDYGLMGLYRFTSLGEAIDTIGIAGEGYTDDRAFQLPWGLAVDEQDNLYVADYTEKCLKLWAASDTTSLQIAVNFFDQITDNSCRWTIKTNKNATLYYRMRSESESVATVALLQEGEAVAIAKNELNRIDLSLATADSYVVDFLVVSSDDTVSEVFTTSSVQADSSEYTEIDLIADRVRDYMVGSSTIDYTNAAVSNRYTALLSLFASAQTAAKAYVIDESLPDLYIDGSSTTDDITHVRDLIEDALGPLAQAYHTSGTDSNPNPYYRNAETLEHILNLYRYLESRGVVAGADLSFAGGGVYLRLTGYYYASFIMKEQLAEAGLLDSTVAMMAWATRWVDPSDDEWGAHVVNNTGRTDGIRTLYNNRLLYTLTMTDETTAAAELAYLVEALNNNFTLGSAWNGFLKPDYSGYHHLGVWGSAYVPDGLHIAAQMAYLLRDTEYALAPVSVENLANGLIALAQYSGEYGVSRGLCGRFPNNLTTLHEHVPAYLYISDALPEGELRTQTETLLCRLYRPTYSVQKSSFIQSVECAITFYGGLGGVEVCEAASDRVANTTIASYNRTFPYASMQVHNHEGALVTMKGYSKYVWDFETNGSENWLGRNQSAGSISIFNVADSEGVISLDASGVGYDGYDWSHVAGATTFDMPHADMLAEAQVYQWAKLSPEWYVGGVSKDSVGLFAMVYSDIRQAYDYDNSRAWLGVKLSANKSVFSVGNMLVCLGSGIDNSHDSYEAHTTIFQNLLPSSGTPIYVDGEAQATLGYEQDWTENTSLWMTDAVGNDYYVANTQGLHIHLNTQSSINDKGASTTTGDYATAWIDHGMETGASYEYAVFVNGYTGGETTPYEVLMHTEEVHAITTGDWTACAVFDATNDVEVGVVQSVSDPVILMYEQLAFDKLELTVTNPELGYYDKDSFPYQVWSIPSSKQYLDAEYQPVTVTLVGEYSIDGGSSDVTITSFDAERNETTFTFNVINAESLTVSLTRDDYASTSQTAMTKGVSVAPNPTTGIVNIAGLSDSDSVLHLYSATGGLMQTITAATSQIDITTYPSGVYWLKGSGWSTKILKL